MDPFIKIPMCLYSISVRLHLTPVDLEWAKRERGRLKESVPIISVSHALHKIMSAMGIVNFQAQWHIFEHLRYYTLKHHEIKIISSHFPTGCLSIFSFLPFMHEVSLRSQKPCGVFLALIWTVTCLFSELTAESNEKCSPLVCYIM